MGAYIKTSMLASIAPDLRRRRMPAKRASALCSPRWIGSEERSSRQRFLAGARLTKADWHLLTTRLRFDAVYYSHFRCNLRRIAGYPNLSPERDGS
jgi:hypothetical protein